MVSAHSAPAASLDERLKALADPVEALARFTANLKAEDVPERVRTRALHHVLDATGIALASTKYEFAQRTLNAISGLGGEGMVPVIGMPAWLSPRDAATVNGLLCHGLDFDDTHLGGVVHPTASALPVALSAAMHSGASGRDMLTAAIIGHRHRGFGPAGRRGQGGLPSGRLPSHRAGRRLRLCAGGGVSVRSVGARTDERAGNRTVDGWRKPRIP